MIMSPSRSFRHFGNRSVTKQVSSIAVRIIHHKRTIRFSCLVSVWIGMLNDSPFIVEPKKMECSAECVDVSFWEMFCDCAFDTCKFEICWRAVGTSAGGWTGGLSADFIVPYIRPRSFLARSNVRDYGFCRQDWGDILLLQVWQISIVV